MPAAPRTLADTGISGVIVDRDQPRDALDSYIAGQAFGLILGGIHAARHAQMAADSAISSIARNMPKVGSASADAFGRTDLPELAAQFRALADALDAVAMIAAPALRDAA